MYSKWKVIARYQQRNKVRTKYTQNNVHIRQQCFHRHPFEKCWHRAEAVILRVHYNNGYEKIETIDVKTTQTHVEKMAMSPGITTNSS